MHDRSQGAPKTPEFMDRPKRPLAQRKHRGARVHAHGEAAEEQVERHYQRLGADLLERRWRGHGGEIDLIFRIGPDIVFVEVKASRSHGDALQHLSRRQLDRLCRSAEDFLGTQPDGSLTPMRLDVALVDGSGQIEILENALMSA